MYMGLSPIPERIDVTVTSGVTSRNGLEPSDVDIVDVKMHGVRRESPLRALGALLVALALLGGAVDLHVLGEDDHGEHGHHALTSGHGGDSHFHVAESHPELPLHVEGSIVLTHPHCQHCMLRLHTPGSELDPKAGVPTLVAAHAVRLPEAPAGETEAARWISARAPPHLV